MSANLYRRRYLVSFRQVHSYLDGRYIDTISRKVLLDIVSGRRKAGAGNATINRDLTAISAVLGTAADARAARSDRPARA